jgi:two-component sensor histidine kinase
VPVKRLEIVLEKKVNNHILLSVADSGTGIMDFANDNSDGFGFELVGSLVDDLDGSISIDEVGNRININLLVRDLLS